MLVATVHISINEGFCKSYVYLVWVVFCYFMFSPVYGQPQESEYSGWSTDALLQQNQLAAAPVPIATMLQPNHVVQETYVQKDPRRVLHRLMHDEGQHILLSFFFCMFCLCLCIYIYTIRNVVVFVCVFSILCCLLTFSFLVLGLFMMLSFVS